MKELSIKEKAKRYDEAIKKAKNCLKDGTITNTAISYIGTIFPELKESDNKRMIQYFKDLAPFDKADELYEKYGFSHKDAIAWLEKQGEKDNLSIDFVLGYLGIKPAYKDGNAWCILLGDNIQEGICGFGDTKEEALIAFIKELIEKQGEKKPNPYSGTSFEYNGHTWGMCARDGGVEILIDGHLKGRVSTNDNNAKEMFIKALERVEEQNAKGYKLTDCDKNSWWEDFKAYVSCAIEQNPAWSEEDDNFLINAINVCEINDYNETAEWLKDLKERVQPQTTWKPSDEQMKAIEFMVRSFGESGTLSPYGETMAYATSLLNDLKKL